MSNLNQLLIFRNSLSEDNKQICVGGQEGEDSCSGDSGGPLMIQNGNPPRWFLLGIVSYGASDCGKKDAPAVYTNVPQYIEWIRRKVLLSGPVSRSTSSKSSTPSIDKVKSTPGKVSKRMNDNLEPVLGLARMAAENPDSDTNMAENKF